MSETSVKRTFNPALAVVLMLGFYLLLTSAFFPLKFLSPFDAKRLLQLVLFATLMIFAIVWSPLRQAAIAQLSRLSSWQSIVVGLFFAIGITSSFQLAHPAYALADVSLLFVMMLLVTVSAASRELGGVQFDRWAVVLIAATGFAVALEEFMGILAGWVLGIEFSFNLALMHFGHPRFYNQVQSWTIPLLAALPLLFPDKRWLKFGCIALLGLQWFLVIMVGARGTFTSLILAMIFIAIWLPGQHKFWLKSQLIGLLVGIVVYLGILLMTSVMIPDSQSGNFYAQSAGRSMAHTSGRSKFWQISVEDAVNHPLLGAGPTRFACEADGYYPAHAHSFVFRILGEWGPTALLLILLLVATIGWSYLSGLKHSNTSNDTDPPLRAMLAISLIAGVIHSGLSGHLTMPASQVSIVLMSGWALGFTIRNPKQTAPSLIGIIPIVLGVFISCAVLVFAVQELAQFRERMSYVALDGRMVPRFWQHGKVCNYSYVQTSVAK